MMLILDVLSVEFKLSHYCCVFHDLFKAIQLIEK